MRIVQNIKVFFVTNILWKIKPDLIVQSALNFSATEADGVWHLYRVLENQKLSLEKRIMIFDQIIEEAKHADMFMEVAKEYSDLPVRATHYERERIFPDDEVQNILYFVGVGELDATHKFEVLKNHLGPEYHFLKSRVGKILADEEKHVDLSHLLNKSSGETEEQFRKRTFIIRLNRFKEEWMRQARHIVNNISSLILGLVYFVCVPFFFIFAKNRLRKRVGIFSMNDFKRLGDK